MKLQNILWFTLATIILSLLIHTSLFSQFSHYKVTFIPNIHGYDINDSTEIVGKDPSSVSGGGAKWKNGIFTTLPHLYDYSTPVRINNASQVAGGSRDNDLPDPPGYINRATYWPNSSTVVDLGVLPECNFSAASSINSSGIICGASWSDTGNGLIRETPFIYDGGMTPYPVYNAMAAAMDINDNGWVIEFAINPYITYILSGGTVIATLPEFYGLKINNKNVVVGSRRDLHQACYWSNGILTSLAGPLGALAVDNNDSGIIIGSSSGKGIIWKNGEMQYLDSLVPPIYTIGQAVAINNKGEIICWERAPQAIGTYLLIPDTMIITSPREGDTWISGEKDTIKWDFVSNNTDLIIDFSSDSGMTYNAIALQVPADSGKYEWNIPKDILSTKCFIRIRDYSTLDTLAFSDIFKIKPYIITRIDPTTGDFIAYDISKDRWGFGNIMNDMWPYSYWFNNFDYKGIDPFTNKPYPLGRFAEAFRYDFPDWISWVNTFGVDACYWSTSLGIYSPTAVETWGINKRFWGGSCAGIANSNALVFNKKNEFINKYPDFPVFNDPITVHSGNSVIKTITELFTHQFGNPIQKYHKDNLKIKTPNQTLNELKQMLREDNTEIRTISFWHNTKDMAHCILPYQIEQDDVNKNFWYIWVYDNSLPNLETALIIIDTSDNGGNGSWSTAYAWQDWGGNGKLILDLPATTYFGQALPKSTIKSSSVFLAEDNGIKIYPSPYLDIIISDDQNNKIGCSGGLITDEITGAVPLIIPTSNPSPPYCYSLPINNYQIEITNFSKDTIGCDFYTSNKIFTVSRSEATNTQKDEMYYWADEKIVLNNPSGETNKTFKLSEIISDSTQEKMFIIRNIQMNENDSFEMTNTDTAKLKLINYGSEKNYEIELQFVNENKYQRFLHNQVSLPFLSNHIIWPDWTDINNVAVTILVDIGNNGTIDDTLYLDNEFTGINDDQGSLIPTEYNIAQNYPNPFNNSTVIKYSIPKEGLVTLKIYDIIGEEVATIVNENKQAGNYQVTFNSANLPSGVYFYRLQAGSFVETKKMILLK